ncbi:MAG: DUF1566 domain-containing protein [Bacteroidetes bacterium]|nr:DUF1566 domain-containing protein [Bacteroidota bacterium]
MNKKLILLILLALGAGLSFAQSVGINDNGSAPASCAMLDVGSTTRGFLPPRMTYAQQQNFSSPVAGSIIFCSNCGPTGELQVYNGTTWTNMTGGAATTPPLIGKHYGGGIIFYINETGLRGLIAAESDQSGGAAWGCYGTFIPTSEAIGTGQTNTTNIVTGCSDEGIAAKICDAYTVTVDGDTYNDWYLPSYQELFQMYIEKSQIGVFSYGYYWSSTGETLNAYVQDFFGNGSPTSMVKGYDFGRVRAVRSFFIGEAGAPTIGTASVEAGVAQATVSFTAPASNGGFPILSYTATSSPGGITGTLNQAGSGAITVTGLTYGTTYTFTVTATNAKGTGLASAASNSVTPTPFYVGLAYGGGKILYVDASGHHGLIAAIEDQGTGTLPWAIAYFQSDSVPGGTGSGIGTGSTNTDRIISMQDSDTQHAAYLARAYNGGGYSDWFLPSKDELNLMYLRQASIGVFSPNWYWSSTENSSSSAYIQYLQNGQTSYTTKIALGYYIRAVRAF